MNNISLENIVFETLVENLLVSKYCLDYRKDPIKWKRSGCFGFPATILLFSITDTIGSYINGGNTKKHFEILNNKNYYNLRLSKEELEEIYKNYRCLLSHNSALPIGRLLDIGSISDPIIKREAGNITLNLVPFWNKSYYCVDKFLKTISLENNNLAKSVLDISLPLIK